MARHVSACLETCHHADDGRLKQNYSSSVHRPAAADVIPTAHVTLHLHTALSNIMACMTSTFMGSAVVCKAKVVAAKKNVGVVASMDGLKKVRTRELMLAESSKPIRPGLCTGSRRVEGLAGEAGVVRRGRGGGQRVLFRVEAGGTGVARRDRCAGMGVVIRSRISPASDSSSRELSRLPWSVPPPCCSRPPRSRPPSSSAATTASSAST